MLGFVIFFPGELRQEFHCIKFFGRSGHLLNDALLWLCDPHFFAKFIEMDVTKRVGEVTKRGFEQAPPFPCFWVVWAPLRF